MNNFEKQYKIMIYFNSISANKVMFTLDDSIVQVK